MLQTLHHFYPGDSRAMTVIADESAELVVTSPPYPIIEMWDALFTEMDPALGALLEEGRGWDAFEGMHRLLDEVWRECWRILTPGGFLCINIGDAVRTLGGEFQLYGNHFRILSGCQAMGFHVLPAVLWWKPTNSPNKFMGAGTYPAGAYVTLEHEYILILRKGGRRRFTGGEEQARRRMSAFFWEERNRWFSDIWDFRGVRQKLGGPSLRLRSAAYPMELPWRLIQMYSLLGDRVVDPFAGTGTTLLAAMAAGRSSVGIDREEAFIAPFREKIEEDGLTGVLSGFNAERLEAHREWAARRVAEKGPMRYQNTHYDFPVVTRQEREIRLPLVDALELTEGGYRITHRL